MVFIFILFFFRPRTPWWMQRCVVQHPYPCRDPFPLDTKPISLAKTTFYGYIVQYLVRKNRKLIYCVFRFNQFSLLLWFLFTSTRNSLSFITFVLNLAVPIKVTGLLQAPQLYLLTKATWWVLFGPCLQTSYPHSVWMKHFFTLFSSYPTQHWPWEGILFTVHVLAVCLCQVKRRGTLKKATPQLRVGRGGTPLCGIYCSWVMWPPLPPPCLSITTFLPLSPLILLLYSVRQASFSCYSVLKIWVWLYSPQRGRDCWLLLPACSVVLSLLLSFSSWSVFRTIFPHL